MRYEVNLPDAVKDAIRQQTEYLRDQGAPEDRLTHWFLGLLDLLDTLCEWPRRFPVAETVTPAKGFEVRRANHGDYARFYRIDDPAQLVEVIAFRHGRQQPWLEGETV
jgi:plasmid stabilization system protein ParE